MVGVLQPLSQNFQIVDANGKPTIYFINWTQQRQQDIVAGVSSDTVSTMISTAFAGRKIIAGTDLTGGGALSSDVTISHATSGVTAGTYGSATKVPQITVDTQGHIQNVTEVTITGGGGGGGVDYHSKGGDTVPKLSDYTLINGSGITSTTVALATRGMVLQFVSVSGLIASTLTKPYTDTGTDFSIKALVGWTSFTSGQGFGVVLKDTSGRFIERGTRNGDVGGSSWNSESSVSSGDTFFSGGFPNQGIVWLRVDRVSGNFLFYLSYDGESWSLMRTESATGFLGATIASVGIGNYSNTNQPFSLTCYYFDGP